jgi:hypothetical protein
MLWHVKPAEKKHVTRTMSVSRNGIRFFKRRSVAMFGWSRPSRFNSEGTTTGLKGGRRGRKTSKQIVTVAFFLLMVMGLLRGNGPANQRPILSYEKQSRRSSRLCSNLCKKCAARSFCMADLLLFYAEISSFKSASLPPACAQRACSSRGTHALDR